MRAVVDTNVIAYFLLGTEEYIQEARTFLDQVAQPQAPAVWEAELGNVLWMAVRRSVVSVQQAMDRLDLAASLGIQSVPNRMLWRGALLRSHQSGVAVYDTLFVELAAREKLPLATFDTGLLRAFPEIASRPAGLSKR